MFRSTSIGAALVAICLLTSAPAAAEVVERHADGFTLRFEVAMETTPEDAYGAVGDIGRWWDGAHTYSGAAANMTLRLEPGGCLCEALANGEAFEHGRVVSAHLEDGVVLNAPLGPLKASATRADLSFIWPSENRGRTLTMTFVVEGPGLGAMADPVNGVMQIHYSRLARYVEYGEP